MAVVIDLAAVRRAKAVNESLTEAGKLIGELPVSEQLDLLGRVLLRLVDRAVNDHSNDRVDAISKLLTCLAYQVEASIEWGIWPSDC